MINLLYESHDDEWQAWIDIQDDPKNGVCLGSGHSKTEALFRAELNLLGEVNSIRQMMRSQNDSHPTTKRKQEAAKPLGAGIRSLSVKIRSFKLWAKAMDPRYYRKITKREHDDLLAQIEWIMNRLENWPESKP